mgnify:CR=1 FL=1
MEPNPSVTVTRPAVLPPAWVPDAVRRYLTHTEEGLSLRELARAVGVSPAAVYRHFPDKNAVIRVQIPTAAALLVVNIFLMYFLMWR